MLVYISVHSLSFWKHQTGTCIFFLIPILLLFSRSFYNLADWMISKRLFFFALNNSTTAAGTVKWIMRDNSTPFFKNKEDRRLNTTRTTLKLQYVWTLSKCVNWICQMEWERLSPADQRHLRLSWLSFFYRFRAVVFTSILCRAILFIYSSCCSLKI